MLFQKEWSSEQPARTEEWVTRSCYQELIGKVGNIQDKPAPLLKIQVTDEGQEGLVKLLLIALLPTELNPQLWEPLLARAVAKAAIGRTAPASWSWELLLRTRQEPLSEDTARGIRKFLVQKLLAHFDFFFLLYCLVGKGSYFPI